MSKTIIFVPTLQEAKKIFDNARFSMWEYNILRAMINNMQVFITGVGKSNAAITAALVASELEPAEIYLTGFCGSYRQSALNVGDMVSVESDYFVDEGFIENGELINTSEIGFPICDNNKTIFSTIDSLKKVNANTVSMLSYNNELATTYYNKTKASVETMEGASIGLVAKKMGISSFHIRAVSNFCGNRNRQGWDVKSAATALKIFFQNNISSFN